METEEEVTNILKNYSENGISTSQSFRSLEFPSGSFMKDKRDMQKQAECISLCYDYEFIQLPKGGVFFSQPSIAAKRTILKDI